MAKQQRVLIVGGGLGGLTLAIALIQRGFLVRVHEQSAEAGELGAGLTLPATSMKVFDAIGIWEKVRDLTVLQAGGVYVHYKTLEVLTGTPDHDWVKHPTSPEQSGHTHRALCYGVLVDELRRLDPEALVLGHRLKAVTQDADSVHATFENGDTDEADLLVGADGVRSATYRSLFGHDNTATFTGVIAVRALIPRTPEVEPFLTGGRFLKYVGPDRGLNRYGIKDGTLINCVALAKTDSWREEGWSNPCSRAEFLELYAGFHDDCLGLIGQAPEGGIFKWALYDREPLETWIKGRATLLGDAAHPMLPYLGQGATAAIEDAFVLARALATYPDHADAFASYEADRIQRTAEQMMRSREQGAALNLGPEGYAGRRPDTSRLQAYDPVTAEV